MTRPLCPFPEIAEYKGSGDINQAASFVCAMEPGKPAQASPAPDVFK